MAVGQFISAKYIKDYSYFDPNVDEKNINIAIRNAQKLYIRPYLGSGLYDELNTQIAGSSLTTLNNTLLNDYVAPALMWWAIYEALPFLRVRFTNKNIVTKTSENSTNVDIKDLEKTQHEVESRARSFTDLLVKYLLQNSTSYPLYINPGSGVDTVFPQNTGFDSDIYLGSRSVTLLTPKQYYDERYKEL